jgi:hypothetical protein
MLLSTLFLLGFAGTLAAAALAPPTPLPAAGGRLQAVHRRTRRWRLIGLVLGIALAAVTASTGTLGRGLALAAPVAALGVLAGVLVGELRVTAPSGDVRRAAVEIRRVRDYLPRRLAGAVAGVTGLLLIVLTWTTAVGSADDMGRAGRAFTRLCAGGAFETGGPWPGSFYSFPLSVLVLGGIVAAAIALHLVVRRPRQAEDREVDDALRRQSARAITAAAGLLVTVPLAGVNLVASAVLANSSCPTAWDRPVVVALLASAPVLLVLAGWFAAVLVAPTRPTRPVDQRSGTTK